MILLDSLYINNGGGKILLDYLVKTLEENNILTYYLFDDRCKEDFKDIPTHRKVYLEASLFKRHQFYKANKGRFTKVFCFGNLPPTIKLNIPVYTYFHQRIYLEIPEGLGFKQKLIFTIKSKIFQALKKNTDLVIVQSESMKEDFIRKYPSLNQDSIKIIPFYEKLNYPNTEDRIKNRIIYVSGGATHKNHVRLLQAYKNVYDRLQKGELVVTIADNFKELRQQIDELINKGYPILNLGFISKENLGIEYAKSEYTIFPSLLESFGLGIVEALETGCKVIGANLPYMYQVCEPSIVFDPLDIKSIEKAFEKAFNKEEKETTQKIFNQIDKFISLLKT